ncbi:adenylyl-sulfate kinase [uncultured Desulfovibrio sp.]|uniref:adenylyl-sulfate kinase n=1 Tax=uncultured Desulfovibrio sp. TaxID=167968 RepID=UPI0025D69614|nr:adenylyl-sulfate kinase [uncultured Desulfovibrio sp.]
MEHLPRQGRVLWITGLSGAGKTTLGKALQQALPGSLLLDGDELREALGADGQGFDAQSRRRLALTYARLAGLLARQGATVIVATISLFHELHAWNRAHLPGYVEIFLDVPESVRRARDPKGLYAANARNMAGSEVPAELPLEPHLRLDGGQSPDDAVPLILDLLAKAISPAGKDPSSQQRAFC